MRLPFCILLTKTIEMLLKSTILYSVGRGGGIVILAACEKHNELL